MNDQKTLNRPIDLAIRIGIFAIVSTLSLRVSTAQTSPAIQAASTGIKLPIYDIVSIKPSKSGNFSEGTETSRDRYLAKNVLILTVIAQAYDVRRPLIYGITGPLESARFDIEAKILDPDPAVMKELSRTQHNAMLRPILGERFKLAVHNEIKSLPVYELVVAKGGPKFQQSPDDKKSDQGTNVQKYELAAHGVSMGNFAGTLTDRVQRTVIDKTGLAENYDLALKWSPDDPQQKDNGSTDAAPNIFTALQEQLGLKLVPAKGPVETLVVDHVELPSEN